MELEEPRIDTLEDAGSTMEHLKFKQHAVQEKPKFPPWRRCFGAASPPIGCRRVSLSFCPSIEPIHMLSMLPFRARLTNQGGAPGTHGGTCSGPCEISHPVFCCPWFLLASRSRLWSSLFLSLQQFSSGRHCSPPSLFRSVQL